MAKRVVSLILAIVAVLGISFVTANYVMPLLGDLFGKRTYSQTNCLTDMITSEMDIYDIAKSYRDGQATVAIEVQGKNTTDNKYKAFIGSGVCVASKGYQTTLDNNYVANKGSYIATNYHVIDIFDTDDFTDCSVRILTEKEETYDCEVLWFDKDLDVAILYCDYTNINYVRMKDRSIKCSAEDKLDYEQVFTIGSPIDTDYLNRLTVGNIASNNNMIFYTSEVIYPSNDNLGNITGYSNYSVSEFATSHNVMSNLYEDVVDIAVGITGGNSGGGLFDKNGYLVGLTTLGSSVEQTAGNQMNGMVPIYPIIEVLDKLIQNNEAEGNNKIYSLSNLNMFGIDNYEAARVSYFYEKGSLSYYFIDGKFFSASYSSAFDFDDDGYYILTNSNTALKSISKGSVIKGAQIDGKERVTILDRNDLIYLLLQIDNGDSVIFYYENVLGLNKTVEVTF